MNKAKAIIAEIDGVLADDSKRRHLIDCEDLPQMIRINREEPKSIFLDPWKWIENPEWRLADWDAYHAAAGEDKVNEWCHQILRLHWSYYQIIFVTDRPEKFNEKTFQWLFSKLSFPSSKLFMRPDYLPELDLPRGKTQPLLDDNRPVHIVKREIFDEHIRDKYDVLFALERDENCCKMWKSLGIQVLRVM